ncbi:MAG TPA: hypothetical protein VLB83_02320 [Candidatus Paceibacterota bacterium]|nr:hypothetical protein [Candidatus Paceibacterota bacterium]
MSPIEEKLVRAERMISEATNLFEEAADDIQGLLTDVMRQFNAEKGAHRPCTVLSAKPVLAITSNEPRITIHITLGDLDTQKPISVSDPDMRDHLAFQIEGILREISGPLGSSVALAIVDRNVE